MKLLLKRNEFFDDTTRGELFVDGKFFCFVCEDRDRGLTNEMTLEEIDDKKIYGKTCIPYGMYQVDITASTRFKRLLPILLNVKGYSGIRIHAGNTSAQTEGCLLPGRQKDPRGRGVLQSKLALDELFPLIKTAVEHEGCTIEIVKG